MPLRSTDFSTFNLHLIYKCQILGQIEAAIKKLSEIQDKAICIISFKDENYPPNELYFNDKTLKISDCVKLSNCLYTCKSILLHNQLQYLKISSKKQVKLILIQLDMLLQTVMFLPQPHVDQYGEFSITYQTGFTWNALENKLGINLLEESNSKIKQLRQLKLLEYPIPPLLLTKIF